MVWRGSSRAGYGSQLIRAAVGLRPELASYPSVVLHGRGSWVAAPPSADAHGVHRWRVAPWANRWRLPDPHDLQEVVLSTLHQRAAGLRSDVQTPRLAPAAAGARR